MKKSLKYTAIVFAGFILLIVAVLLSTQTAFFREKVKEKLIKVVEAKLNLSLEIEQLNGNFYNYLSFSGIKFSDGDSAIATFAKLKINYDLFSLKDKTIDVDSLIIENPVVTIWQNPDSLWSLKGYIKPKKDTLRREKKPFNFKIDVNHLAIKQGNFSIFANNKIIPSSVSGFNLLVSGTFTKNLLKINLKNSGFHTKNPSLTMNNLSGIYTKDNNGMRVDSFLLVTARSNIGLAGNFESKKNLSADINASKIDKNELRIFVPSFKLTCSPSVKVDFETTNDTVYARAEIKHNEQSVFAEISLQPFTALFDKTAPVPYSADLTFNNFRLENWIDINNQQVLVNGKIEVKGNNLLDSKPEAKITADLNNSLYGEIVIDTLLLTGNYLNDSLYTDLEVKSKNGNLLLTGNLTQVTSVPGYTASIVADNLDITSFMPTLKGTKVNGLIRIKGRGFKSPDYKINATLKLHESSVYGYFADSIKVNTLLENSLLTFDSLQLTVPGGFATGKGNLALDSLLLDSDLEIVLDSLTFLDSVYVLPIEFDSLAVHTNISGPFTRLELNGQLHAENAEGYSVKLKELNATFSGVIKKDSLYVQTETVSHMVETGPMVWDTIRADVSYFGPEIGIGLQGIRNNTISVKLNTQISTKETLAVSVPLLEISTLLSDYYLGDTLVATLTKNKDLNIQNLLMKDRNQPDFVLNMQGDISTTGNNNFEVLVNRLDLARLNRFIQKEDSLRGLLSSKVTLAGTAENPEIDGTIDISNPAFGTRGFTSFATEFNYINQKGTIKCSTPDLGPSFYFGANAEFKAYFDSLSFIFSPPETFEAELIFDSLDIAQSIKKLVANDSLSGIVNADIKASGPINSPLFYGNLNLDDGFYVDSHLGIYYDKIKTSVVFDGKKVLLDTLLIKQNDGLFSVTGQVEFDSTLIKGNIVSSSIEADASNFFVTKHRNYEVLIDAKTFIQTDKNNPEFGGNIKVLRSDIYLPALISTDQIDDENENLPLLVQALAVKNDSTQVGSTDEKEESKNREFTILNNLTGKLRIEIPRNTWLKSEDMRIELRGDVEVVKTGPFFELFGNIDIVRGHYILYGKKLNIKESEIIFQGGEELDPNLNFTAEYVYRGSDKDKRYLELNVTGLLSEPEINFRLDGNEITETDAVSILIFGATSDEMGYSGQNGLVGSIGSNAVASVITSQLNKTLGSQFNLDMIEVTATENWQSAAFVVGKYITNDIFVIYQRGFGESEGDEITPETIIVEYELNDKLFLRLQSGSSKTSGIDVILKFEQKKK